MIEQDVLIAVERVGVEQEPLATGEHVRVEVDGAGHLGNNPRLARAVVFVNRKMMAFEDGFVVEPSVMAGRHI